jgi:hypothetical protein
MISPLKIINHMVRILSNDLQLLSERLHPLSFHSVLAILVQSPMFVDSISVALHWKLFNYAEPQERCSKSRPNVEALKVLVASQHRGAVI